MSTENEGVIDGAGLVTPVPEPSGEVIDVVLIENKTAMVKLSRTRAALEALREQYENVPADTSNPEALALTKAANADLVGLRNVLEDRRQELKKPYLDAGKMLDAEARALTQEIAKLEAPYANALAKHKADQEAAKNQAAAAEAERVRAHEQLLAKIERLPSQSARFTTAQFDQAIADLEQHRTRDWQEYAERATNALANAEETLQLMRQAASERAMRAEQQASERERRLLEEEVRNIASLPSMAAGMNAAFIKKRLAEMEKPTAEAFGELFDAAQEAYRTAREALQQMQSDAEARETAEATAKENQRQLDEIRAKEAAAQKLAQEAATKKAAALGKTAPTMFEALKKVAASATFSMLEQDVRDAVLSAVVDGEEALK